MFSTNRTDRIILKKIFDAAIKGLPLYAVPEYSVMDDYTQDIVIGLAYLINKYGYYKRMENKENEYR